MGRAVTHPPAPTDRRLTTTQYRWLSGSRVRREHDQRCPAGGGRGCSLGGPGTRPEPPRRGVMTRYSPHFIHGRDRHRSQESARMATTGPSHPRSATRRAAATTVPDEPPTRNPLLPDQPTGHGKRLLVGHSLGLVDNGQVQHAQPLAPTNPLDLVSSVEVRVPGVNQVCPLRLDRLFSGMTQTSREPRMAATRASPIPVFPAVASTSIIPGGATRWPRGRRRGPWQSGP